MGLSERERLMQERAEVRVRRMRQKYERLASRRGVRIALGASRIVGPWLGRARTLSAWMGKGGKETGGGARGAMRDGGEDMGPRSLDVGGLLAAIEARACVTVIVPVYNAREATERCLRSVSRNSTNRTRVLVVDDASSDPSLVTFLDALQEQGRVSVVRLEENAGFAGAVNEGLKRVADDDVILLNSDVAVGPGWERNLTVAARSYGRVASVTPLSNSAGALSAPGGKAGGSLVEELGIEGAARLVARSAGRGYTEVPVGHGFCLYLTREAIEEVGWLDSAAFPRGYGEEIDWCFRAARLGFRHLVDHKTYVWHEHGASFGDGRNDLIRSGREVIDKRYPDYSEVVREMQQSETLAGVRQMVADAWRRAEARPMPRVLYISGEGVGAWDEADLAMMRRMEGRYEPLIVECATRRLRLHELSGGRAVHLETYDVDDPGLVASARQASREAFARVLWDYAVELVDIGYLSDCSLVLPEIANKLDVPAVCRIRCGYGEDHVHWRGPASPAGEGPSEENRPGGSPSAEGRGPAAWRKEVGEALGAVDRVVACCERIRSVYESRLVLGPGKVEVIEEGHEPAQKRGVAVSDVPSRHHVAARAGVRGMATVDGIVGEYERLYGELLGGDDTRQAG